VLKWAAVSDLTGFAALASFCIIMRDEHDSGISFGVKAYLRGLLMIPYLGFSALLLKLNPPNEGINVCVIIIAVIAIPYFYWVQMKCPKCKKCFYSTGLHYNGFAKKCLHCGLSTKEIDSKPEDYDWNQYQNQEED